MYSYFRHPNKFCLSYYNHFKISLYYSKKMLIGSIKACIHAFFPFLFITSTTKIVNTIQKNLNKNNCN